MKKKIKEEFLNENTRFNRTVIVYTNIAVNHYNRLIRRSLGFKKQFIVYDLLMGYENIGKEPPLVENGQMYVVKKIRNTTIHSIRLQSMLYDNLEGQIITTQEIFPALEDRDKYGMEQSLFFPDIESEANYDVLLELVRRSEKVNSKNSSKKDYLKYMDIKSQLFFREGVYKYEDKMEKETSFKENHSILFTNLLDVIEENEQGCRKMLENDLTRQIDDKYPEIRQFRIEDSKPFSDVETLADRFQVLGKDIDYGYSITTHKCVSENSLISTKNGLFYIKDLTENDDWSDLNIDLYSKDDIESTSKIYRGKEETSIKITTEFNYFLEGSYRHPILILDFLGNEKWKLLPDIELGDTVIIRHNTQTCTEELKIYFELDFKYKKKYKFPKNMTTDLAYLLGILVGDGSYNDVKENRIDYCTQDQELKEKFLQCMKDLFGVEKMIPQIRKTNFHQYNIYNKIIRRFLLHCGLTFSMARTKHIPKLIFQSNVDCQKEFIKGLFDTDGGVNKQAIHFSTSSEILGSEVHFLLLSLGYISSKHYFKSTDSWRINIYGNYAYEFTKNIGFIVNYKQNNALKIFKKSFKSNVGEIPNGKELIVSLKSEIISTQKRKDRIDSGVMDKLSMVLTSRIINNDTKFRASHLSLFVNGIKNLENYYSGRIIKKYYMLDYFFVKVIKIENSVCKMYDFEVPKSHSFISNGLVSHNCQGSTIDITFIDDTDFDRIKDRWNFRVGMMERRLKEKNQLRYTAYTRAKTKIYALTKF